MYRIINRKKYNTDTATKLCSIPRGHLYKTAKGQYFKVYEGAYEYNDYETHLDLVDEGEARRLVEAYSNDEYENIFGKVEEG